MINLLLTLCLIISTESRTVSTSIYNPTVAQCNPINPLITASGTKIDREKLRAGKLRYISISRDLRQYYKYHTYITIKSSNPYYNGKWKVVDCMNKRFRNKVDFLQAVGDRNVPPKKVIII